MTLKLLVYIPTLVGSLWIQSGDALAFCSEPNFYETTPSPPYSKPSVPYCMNDFAWSREHTCEQYEIDSYISDINRYIKRMNDYVNEANQLARGAIDFAKQASEFAECRVKEVKATVE